MTRDRDIIFSSFLIRQDSFDANCLNEERILTNCFDVNKVSIDAKDRKFDCRIHLFFHSIKNFLNQILCVLHVLFDSIDFHDSIND